MEVGESMLVCEGRRKHMEASGSNGSRWKLLKVYKKCGSSWKFMDARGSTGSW